MCVAIGLLSLPLNHWLVAAAVMFLLGLTIGASGPVVGSLWVEIYGNKHIGAIRSTVTSIMVVSTAASPVLFGWLFDYGYQYNEVMCLVLIFLLIGLSSLLVLRLDKVG